MEVTDQRRVAPKLPKDVGRGEGRVCGNEDLGGKDTLALVLGVCENVRVVFGLGVRSPLAVPQFPCPCPVALV